MFGRNLANEMHPVRYLKFIGQTFEPRFVRTLTRQRQMPFGLIREQTYRGIKALVGMKPPDTAKQHRTDRQVE